AGQKIVYNGTALSLLHDIPAKHKFVEQTLNPDDEIIMYGVLVGKALDKIPAGAPITTQNVKHKSSNYEGKTAQFEWKAPDVTKWKNKTFLGYHRADGQVGTANYWVVLPLVFCENRNVNVMRDAFEEVLGFSKPDTYKNYVSQLADFYKKGETNSITAFRPVESAGSENAKLFENIDGIKFLTH